MASIGKQINTARKAKGMTQEELGKAIGFSRATVSSWEIDRRLPDAKTLLKLSVLLDWSFETEDAEHGNITPQEESLEADEPREDGAARNVASEPAAPDAGEGAEPEDCVVGRGARKPDKRLWIAAAVLAVVICLFLAVHSVLGSRRQAVPSADTPVDPATVTKAYFMQDNVKEAGKPYFNIDVVLTTQKNDNLDMWLYTFRFLETNGLPFSIDRLEIHTFVRDTVHSVLYSRDMLSGTGLEVDIPARGAWSVNGGLPVQDSVSGIGCVLRGKSEDGQSQSFVCYLPLTIE